MKTLIYSAACLLALWAGACSYSDDSTLNGDPIPDIVIDTTGIPVQLTGVFGEQLVVTPTVSSASNPEKDFTYEWKLSLDPTSSDINMNPEYKVAGTGEHLDYTVDVTPDINTYQLWYRVTDNKTKQMKSIMWHVLIDAGNGQGLLVAHSPDGTTSDLTLVQDWIYTAAFRETATAPATPTLIKPDLYSAAHDGERYPGIIREMLFLPRLLQRRATPMVDIQSGDRISRVNLINYETVIENEEMFLFADPVIDIQNMLVGSGSATGYPRTDQQSIIINRGGFQRMTAPKPDDSDYSVYGYGRFTNGSRGDAESSVGIAMTYDVDPIASQSAGRIMFYDRMNGRFIYFSNTFTETTAPTQCNQSGTAFDPRNVGQLEVLAAGLGNTTDHRFVVKRDGKYEIMTFVESNGASRALINVSDAPNIDKATYFLVCVTQPVIYYATSDDEIYSIHFLLGLGDNVTYNKVYTSPEPINGLYATRQNSAAKRVEYPMNALTVTTTTGQTDGKVWVLPMDPSGNGALETSKMVTFSGFNRISNLITVD